MTDELTIKYIPLSRAVLWERNPKRHDIGGIAQSIRRYGFKDEPHFDPSLNEGSGGIVEGNGRLVALQMMLDGGDDLPRGLKPGSNGEWLVPIKFGVDAADEREAKAYALDHNNLTLSGSDFTAFEMAQLWENEYTEVLTELAEVGKLPVSVSGDDLDALLKQFEEPPEVPEPQIDKAEELQKKWKVQEGDLWQLGKHRLACGDCRDLATAERLVNGNKVNGVFTSPPYAEQRKKQYGGVPTGKYVEWWENVQANVRAVLAEDGSFFVNIKAHAKDKQRTLYVFDLVCAMVRDWKWLFVDEYCWLRTGIPQQVTNRFKNQFEPIYWFANSDEFGFNPLDMRHASANVPIALGPGAGDTSAAKRQGKGGGAIQGNEVLPGLAFPGNVLDFRGNATALGHSASFPLRLPTFFICAHSDLNDTWLDPFAGSGTVLMACENEGRIGLGIEILPKYCAVTIQRWVDLTGGRPERL